MKISHLLLAVSLLFTIALPITAVKADMGATLPCPACGMPMTKMKTSTMVVPLLVHGKKWYCCAECAAGKAAAAYDAKHKGKLFVAEK